MFSWATVGFYALIGCGETGAEINSPVVAVGNNSADRELIGSLGFKCRAAYSNATSTEDGH